MALTQLIIMNTTMAPSSFNRHGLRHTLHYFSHDCHQHSSHRFPVPAVASSATNDWKFKEALPEYYSITEVSNRGFLLEKCWQRNDFLPAPESEGFYEHVKELRERSMEVPDEYYVVLVGDMITEEALPTYQTMLNSMDGVRDKTGVSPSSWAVWNRSWTAEENRHGDLLSHCLYLSGRVDMKQIQKTIQYLIGSGMDPKFEKNPYNSFIHTSFQERTTFITHRNTARQAKQYDDLKLAQIYGTIAADEKRDEIAYSRIAEKLFELDPDYVCKLPLRISRLEERAHDRATKQGSTAGCTVPFSWIFGKQINF